MRTRERTANAKSNGNLYGGGVTGRLLSPEHDTPEVRLAIQRRHQRGNKRIDDEGYYVAGDHAWKVPYGYRHALRQPLSWSQTTNQFPFYVRWTQPNGKRCKKNCSSLIVAIHLITTRIQYVDPYAYIVSHTCGYIVPRKLMGKFPIRRGNHTYYWCPCCMAARRFTRARPLEDFYAIKKFWSADKARFIWKDVKLALLTCSNCGLSNRDHKFRVSNQPYHKVTVKRRRRRK